ncbi:uncharacterized protein [Primulina eburnea]|uniref:uncharacterized protein n=1 Tax=Primulina eburnea TaxID=1245227 RepID=UPI003C6CA17D
MNRVWMAVTVAAVNTHTDQGQKLRSGLNSLNQAKNRFLSGGTEAAADIRPLAGMLNSVSGGFMHGEEEKRRQKDESFRQVMYLNCWGQN